MAMDGIAELVVDNTKGKVQYKVINDAGGLSILDFEEYFLPDIKVRLFRPKVFI